MTDTRKHNYVTDGSVLKAIIKLSWPVVFSNILQSAYNLTDTFWVGRLGKDAVAAVSFSFPIIFLLISAGAGFSVAGTVLVSHYKGARRQKGVNFIASQTLMIITVLSFIISTAGFMLSGTLMHLMGASPAVLPMAVSYLKISFAGLYFLFAFFVFQSLLRGVGVVKLPMMIVLGTVLLNFAADPLFIMGWGPVPAFGVSGAALATILTQGVAAVSALAMFLSGKYGIKFELRNFKPDMKTISKMFKLGLPASLEHSTRAASFAVLVFLVGSFGTAAVASYGIVTRIMSFIIIPAVGLAMAATTLVGQNMGAGQPERAEKIALIGALFAFVIMTVAGIVFFVFSRVLMGIFIPANADVINSGSFFIKIVSLTFGFIGFQIVLGGVFRGSGNTFTAMAFTMFTFIVLRIALSWGLSSFTALNEKGIWLAFPVSNVVGGCTVLFFFLRGGWKKKKLISSVQAEEYEF